MLYKLRIKNAATVNLCIEYGTYQIVDLADIRIEEKKFTFSAFFVAVLVHQVRGIGTRSHFIVLFHLNVENKSYSFRFRSSLYQHKESYVQRLCAQHAQQDFRPYQYRDPLALHQIVLDVPCVPAYSAQKLDTSALRDRQAFMNETRFHQQFHVVEIAHSVLKLLVQIQKLDANHAQLELRRNQIPTGILAVHLAQIVDQPMAN